MRRATLIAFALFAATTAVEAGDHPAKLVGRWRSENMPVGYWIIDRYSDGRLARKEYVRDHWDKPAEIIVMWGRWRLRGKTYSVFFAGTTSDSARAYLGKWWKMNVQRITATRFSHLSGDGHDTFENRFADAHPLLDIEVPPPKEYGWKNLVDTVMPSRRAIPLWVNSVAKSPGP
jgi:hypothetical protein